MIYKMDVVSFISFTLGASLSLSAGAPHFHAFHPLLIAVVRVSKVSGVHERKMKNIDMKKNCREMMSLCIIA